ncbi:MAG: FAD-dependent oxidoreductase [Spirochaetales bacterium]|nr:FAD-dependent oxidoreductase [Spirochaetales bacterium]
MKIRRIDVLVIGAGASGLTSAIKLAEMGYEVSVVERENTLGGILNQCIHSGFGLHYFNEELTGPEFADRLIGLLPDALYLAPNATVDRLIDDENGLGALVFSPESGITRYSSRAIVLAMGCRERNRGNIHIPGSRPSGVYTAGLAQRLVNIEGYIPGKDVVIVGSGDIGLIMARRMSWVGAKVHCVVEIQPYPSGLTRNIVQCLNDFNIPLHLSHVVTKINGNDRVQSVEISPVSREKERGPGSFTVECDTLLLSVGLVPENELTRKFGIAMNHETSGPKVDSRLMTSKPGVFACGNVLHVHDLVDYACEEAERCAKGVDEFLRGVAPETGGPVVSGANVRYVVPGAYNPGSDNRFYLRPMIVKNKSRLSVRAGEVEIYGKNLPHVQPSEMVEATLSKDALKACSGQTLEVRIE